MTALLLAENPPSIESVLVATVDASKKTPADRNAFDRAISDRHALMADKAMRARAPTLAKMLMRDPFTMRVFLAATAAEGWSDKAALTGSLKAAGLL